MSIKAQKLQKNDNKLQKLSTIFQNQIEKRQTIYNMQLHRNRLNDAMKSTRRNYFLQRDYKDILYDNAKKEYIQERRNDQIQRENILLFQKISKINDKTKRYSNYSHLANDSHKKQGSLNSHVRKLRRNEISVQNMRMYKKLIKLKPSISFQETDKQFNSNRKMLSNMSKIEKFRLMDYAKPSNLTFISHGSRRSSIQNQQEHQNNIPNK